MEEIRASAHAGDLLGAVKELDNLDESPLKRLFGAN